MTTEAAAPPLAALTTLGVGGPPRRLVEATTREEVVAAVREVDSSGEPLLLLGGGSNLLVGDAGFDGTVVRIASTGIDAEGDSCGGAWVTVEAGEPWDSVAATAVESGWIGVEALAGIPGSTGATPVQNVGAYGQEVSDTVAQVVTWDREAGAQQTFTAAECGFGYRTSRFRGSDRWVVLAVTYQLTRGDLAAPVRYAELARRLSVEIGDRVPLADLRDAVLDLRRGKGMVLDAADPDTRSAGSFFVNPVLDTDTAAGLPPEAPRWQQPDGRVKTSAAWLIEHAGFTRGHALGRARISTKHTLAITNPGSATAADVVALAREVRDGVERAYGLRLEPEPRLVGVSLDQPS